MKTSILYLILLSSHSLYAQTTDSIDNILLKIPSSWKVNKQPDYIELTTYNSQHGFCQVIINKQQPSANKNTTFHKEWSDVVLASFETGVAAKPEQKKIRSGQVLSFSTQTTNKANGAPYYIELNQFDCGSYVQSVMIAAGNQQQLQSFETEWQSLITGVKNNGLLPVAISAHQSFQGQWAKRSSNPYSTGSTATNRGYYVCQYDFKPDGTYSFHGESRGGTMKSDEYILINESGAYSVLDKQLILMPAKSNMETADGNGKIKKTQKLDNARRIYNWELHYLEGLNETNMVLTPVKPYAQDGSFAANAQFANSYLYSKEYRPEWKIEIK